ncbi:MAG: 2-amino-4-hydroxy-6-hydroxymethyldihydropteridine diphosphokinase [Chitinispirillaceae bacterium]|nr:2-amino-4-hydroxy-6-hydroxymethyldihydropteridine diphosphokinase [Chitinispirillaceae bacterium]
MADVILCLGGNLGDRAAFLRLMEAGLEGVLLPPVRKSRLMETEPLGVTAGHPWYYNRLLRGGYDGAPHGLLETCQAIEKKCGRTRAEKYAPRTADIDILLFGDMVVSEKDLIIPHRHIRDRRFCLEGLREIAAEWIVPGTGASAGILAGKQAPGVRKQQIRYPAA